MKGRHALSLNYQGRLPTRQVRGSPQQQVFTGRRPLSEVETKRSGDRFSASDASTYTPLYESAPIACLILDDTGRILGVNAYAEKFFGKEAEFLEGYGLERQVAESDHDTVKKFIQRIFTCRDEVKQTVKMVSTVSGRVDVELRSVQIDGPHTPRLCVCALLDSLEERRTSYESRRDRTSVAHTARLGIVGEMAAEIAHELNQPLATILTYARICQNMITSDRSQPEELQEILGKIVAQANHAGTVVRRIRDFMRKDEKILPVDVNVVINDALDLVEAEMGKHAVDAITALDNALPPVSADATHLAQVVVNLLRNAIEAMNDVNAYRKTIMVSTHYEAENNAVKITISDTGPGVCAGDEEIIFKPFFTTKPKGMGLGLSLSRSIVESYDGRMRCEPNKEGGSRFDLILPAVEGGCDDRQYADRIYRR